jgi:hypothetical protein
MPYKIRTHIRTQIRTKLTKYIIIENNEIEFINNIYLHEKFQVDILIKNNNINEKKKKISCLFSCQAKIYYCYIIKPMLF